MARAAPTGWLALAAALAAACGGRPEGFSLHGARVVVDTDAPFAARADLPARLESTIEVALAYWGGEWRDLDGRAIEITRGPVACGGASGAIGCFDGDVRVATEDPGAGTFRCVEETGLVHEIGHAVVGDPLHEDPRWMQFEPVAAALAGRTGYGPDGEVDCVLWTSVWRHPLGRP